MFGFSLFKIIFTIAIVVAVWQGFKYVTRLQENREKRDRMDAKKSDKTPPGVEDMEQCPVCNAYTPRGSKSCGKENCPYTG
ncbi:hypothetical protein ACFL12_06625 [Pseudomonadota bacterium]